MHNQLDPFYENELLAERDKKQNREWGKTDVRFTKTKAILRQEGWSDREGDDTLELRKSTGSAKRGTVEIKICTWQHRKLADNYRCDMGHSHPRLKVDKIYLESWEISRAEAVALAKWILKNER